MKIGLLNINIIPAFMMVNIIYLIMMCDVINFTINHYRYKVKYIYFYL